MEPPSTEVEGAVPDNTGSIFTWKFVAHIPK
jgi:hypothetical protein